MGAELIDLELAMIAARERLLTACARQMRRGPWTPAKAARTQPERDAFGRTVRDLAAACRDCWTGLCATHRPMAYPELG